ncbi:MAG: hypothetical protein WAW03_04005 [Anaerolineae bacterium]|uniref:hypothetical protein n=1 Tax=Candidatus Amarolinea dominans TaxID=3140696 RepID=UPI001D9C6A9A|nr:hypothetical protein [Anaerolineae bacterium]MBK7199886.1 hypothetical protein [Anaerolineae bacterium]MBK9229381.1 hypothetical protein [Anaerolineae bacterium]
MTLQTILETATYEQALVSIIHTLPAERIRQIVDYARFVQTQTLDEFALLEEADPASVAADEAVWEAQFAATQVQLTKMAKRVRGQIRAGQAKPMVFTKDGRILPE